MDNKTVVNYNLPAVRSMTRKELRALLAKGLDMITSTEQDKRKLSADMVDYILDVVFKGHDFEDVPQDVLNLFAVNVYNKTYGLATEAKN